MILYSFNIVNFRLFDNIDNRLDLNISLYLGENNIGKSSVIDALEIAFEKLDILPSDFKSTTNKNFKPIILSLTFEEVHFALWTTKECETFKNHLYKTDSGLCKLVYKIVASYNLENNSINVERGFCTKDGIFYPSPDYKLVFDYMKLIKLENLSSVRTRTEDRSYSIVKYIKYLMQANKIDESLLPDETGLNEIWLELLDNENFEKASKHWPMVDDIKSFDYWDSGLQTMVGIAIFLQFFHDGFLQNANFILTLEEPESNLYPLSVRTLGYFLANVRGQKIMITHSSEFLSQMPLRSLRRFYYKDGDIRVNRIRHRDLNRKERLKVEYAVQSQRGRLFFSNVWFLIEGQSEFVLFPKIAQMLGYNFDLLGITCVEFSQTGVVSFVKMAKALGIDFFIFTDNDFAGKKYRDQVKESLNTNDISDYTMHTGYKDIEHLFYHEGYADFYKSLLSENTLNQIKKDVGNDKSDLYIEKVLHKVISKHGKPLLMMKLLNYIKHDNDDEINLGNNENTKYSIEPKPIPYTITHALEKLYYRSKRWSRY